VNDERYGRVSHTVEWPDVLTDRCLRLQMDEHFDSELVIGLVSAVGTENKRVVDLLKECLNLAGYTVHEIKLSQDVIPALCPVAAHGNNQFNRITNLMDAGNKARELSKDNSILALGAATEIFAKRTKDKGNTPQKSPKTAYIIDSLKRPEEVARLRLIYPSGFLLIGIHSDLGRRRKHLVNVRVMSAEEADVLIGRDGEESKVNHGQRVNKTFHMADFFVKITPSQDQLRCDVTRIVSAWFGNPFVTPTFDEHAMFMAFAAALRSADMSRQVGAVVTRKSQILSTGANDCPKAGGGLYWPERNAQTGCIEDHLDGRDFKRADGDSNRAEQRRIIERIVEDGEKQGLDPKKLTLVLENSPLRDLTEYGRVVHAEMEALLCCSRIGLSTAGTTLYSTTFPCHNCAKHIIAAGVERVVYVEPYPKSKALEFHRDSIAQVGENEQVGQGLVIFDAFVGIGPRRFFDLFSMRLGSSYDLDRKNSDTGLKTEWRIESSRLRVLMHPTSYLENETNSVKLYVKAVNEMAKN
jgi:deoxycytidylate deaminase